MRSLAFTQLFIFVLLLGACKTQVQNGNQGITGQLSLIKGNQMPPNSGSGTPVERVILVYEATQLDDADGSPPLFNSVKTKLIAKSKSNNKGEFKISLPVGQYSVFVQEDGKLFANLFDSKNMIHLVDVKENTWKNISISINHSASF